MNADIHAGTSRCRPTNARYTLITGQRTTNANTPSALDTCRHMQEHAKLGILAYTRRLHMCMYMHSSNTCRCIQSCIQPRHILMQKPANLGIHAYTFRPSICACICIVPIHADAYSHAYRHTLMQKPAKLVIPAYTCRLQYVHVHA
jgi:hypothetical protein